MSTSGQHSRQGRESEQGHAHPVQPVDLAQRGMQPIGIQSIIEAPKSTYATQLRPTAVSRPLTPAQTSAVIPVSTAPGVIPVGITQVAASSGAGSQSVVSKSVTRTCLAADVPVSLPGARHSTTTLTLVHPGGSAAGSVRSASVTLVSQAVTHPSAPVTHIGSYHVPRGPAVVASISAPRSAVATPIVRSGASHLQTAGSAAAATASSYPSTMRGASSSLVPRATVPVCTATTWFSSANGVQNAAVAAGVILPPGATHVPKLVPPSPGVLNQSRAVSVTSVPSYAQIRAPVMTVSTRALTPSARPLGEPSCPTMIHTAVQKPVQITHAVAPHITQITEKGYYKPTGQPVTLAQTLPHPRGTPVTYPSSSGTGTHLTTAGPRLPSEPSNAGSSQRVTVTAVPSGSTSLISSTTPVTAISVPVTVHHSGTGTPVAIPIHPTVPVSVKSGTTALVVGSKPPSLQQPFGPKVITQPAHGPPIKLPQVPLTTQQPKPLGQTVHTVAPLQHITTPITTSVSRTVTYTTTALHMTQTPATRPVTVTAPQPVSSSIPVAKVYPQPPTAANRSGLDLTTGATQHVPGSAQPQTASLYIQTAQRASPAPFNSPQVSSTSERTPVTLSTYPLPTTAYYYETSAGYQMVGSSGTPMVAHPFTGSGPYTVATTATLRPAVSTQVHTSIVTGGTPMRINPVMVVDPTQSSVPGQSAYSAEAAAVQTGGGSQAIQTTTYQPQTNASKPNASPRPSILRKRDSDGTPHKGQKNLTAALVTLQPTSPPSPKRPDSAGNGSISSGSTTISATSSPGMMMETTEDIPTLLTSIKQELPDEIETPAAPVPIVEMSPRKKPRKQQLIGNEMQEARTSEEEMEFLSEDIKKEPEEEEEIIFIPKRSSISLLNSYRHTWKSRHNHFLRYSDVKPKDERRPTVNDLANQKQVVQKVNGWKIYHLSTQMEDLAHLESQVHQKLSEFLGVMERKPGKESERDLNRVNELIKGNIQRSKVIKDQMLEAKTQVLKVIDHKTKVTEIIAKYVSKRPVKKREKT